MDPVDFSALVSVSVGTPGHNHALQVRFSFRCLHMATHTSLTKAGTDADFDLTALYLCHPFDASHDVLVSWHHFTIIVGPTIANTMLTTAKDQAHDSGEFVL